MKHYKTISLCFWTTLLLSCSSYKLKRSQEPIIIDNNYTDWNSTGWLYLANKNISLSFSELQDTVFFMVESPNKKWVHRLLRTGILFQSTHFDIPLAIHITPSPPSTSLEFFRKSFDSIPPYAIECSFCLDSLDVVFKASPHHFQLEAKINKNDFEALGNKIQFISKGIFSLDAKHIKKKRLKKQSKNNKRRGSGKGSGGRKGKGSSEPTHTHNSENPPREVIEDFDWTIQFL